MIMKRLKQILVCIAFVMLVSGCAHKTLVGQGPVLNSIKVEKKDVLHAMGHSSTIVGIGLGTGAVIGAAIGVGLTVVTLGLAAPLIPITTIAGGASGAAVGATGGAIYGYASNRNEFLFSYAVHNDKDGKKYLIHQYDKKMIVKDTMVKIYHDKGDVYYIAPMRKTSSG